MKLYFEGDEMRKLMQISAPCVAVTESLKRMEGFICLEVRNLVGEGECEAFASNGHIICRTKVKCKMIRPKEGLSIGERFHLWFRPFKVDRKEMSVTLEDDDPKNDGKLVVTFYAAVGSNWTNLDAPTKPKYTDYSHDWPWRNKYDSSSFHIRFSPKQMIRAMDAMRDNDYVDFWFDSNSKPLLCTGNRPETSVVMLPINLEEGEVDD